MGTTLDGAGEILAVLVEAEIQAFTDPAAAVNNRPCVLIGPPTADYVNKVRTYRLRCLASSPSGDLRAWEELDALETAVVAVLPVESSEPVSYAISEDKPKIPCHSLTVRTNL